MAAFEKRLFAQNQFAVKFGLSSIQCALAIAGQPQRTHRRVLVGGTNGKGSVASQLAAILQASGLKVGLFTSPHLVSVRERFRVDGRPADEPEVLRVGWSVMDRFGGDGSTVSGAEDIGRIGAEAIVPCELSCNPPVLTFFELCTVIAAELFRDSQVDVAIYEVGLGGRLDAVNGLDRDIDLSIIATIGLDHVEVLGDTVDAIVRHKAGIMRPGSPVVMGIQERAGAQRALDAAAIEVGARVVELDQEALTAVLESLDYGAYAELPAAVALRSNPVARKHALTAVSAARELLGEGKWSVPAATRGLAGWRWAGRLDAWTLRLPTSKREVTFIMDAAHNPDGLSRSLEVIGAWGGAAAGADVTPRGAADVAPVRAVLFGCMRDKDVVGLVRSLRAGLLSWVSAQMGPIKLVPVAVDSPRACPAAEVRAQAIAAGFDEEAVEHVDSGAVVDGLERAADVTGNDGRVLVCGSIYVLGDVLQKCEAPAERFSSYADVESTSSSSL